MYYALGVVHVDGITSADARIPRYCGTGTCKDHP
jgi:hypothetical protein